MVNDFKTNTNDNLRFYYPIRSTLKISAEGSRQARPMSLGMRGYAIGRIIGNIIATDNPGWLIYLPDDEGYTCTLDKKTVSSILENDDRELFERFKADRRPKNSAILKEYIQEFNQRNFNSIHPTGTRFFRLVRIERR